MERAGGEGGETLPMPSLPVKAGSWQQGMYEDTALSPEMVGARSRCGGALDLREWGGKRLRAGEKQSQQGDRDRDSQYGAPCDRCPILSGEQQCLTQTTWTLTTETECPCVSTLGTFLFSPNIPYNCFEIHVLSLPELLLGGEGYKQQKPLQRESWQFMATLKIYRPLAS